MSLEFKKSKSNTVGVEIELQIIDPETKELADGSPAMLLKAKGDEHIKQEFFQSLVEINTDPCNNLAELRKDLCLRVSKIQSIAEECGFELAGASTHPFSSWKKQRFFPDRRYQQIVKELQYLGRRMLTFGTHVHVGVDDPDKAICINNAMINYLPLIFSLTTSAPFWDGMDTGLASIRPKIFESLPNAGLPPYLYSWKDYVNHYELLCKAKSIKSVKELWWDVRPHPMFGTVEIRTCDVLSTLDETIAIAALIQALVAFFSERYDNDHHLEVMPYILTKENRWRSIRYGLDAELIDMKNNIVSARYQINEMLDDLAEIATRLDSTKELMRIKDILKNGTSAQRQRAVYKKTGSHKAIVESLVTEFKLNSLCLI